MSHDCHQCGGPCACGGDAGPGGCSCCPQCRERNLHERIIQDRRNDDADHVDEDDDRSGLCHHGVSFSEDCEDCDLEGDEDAADD